MGKLTLTFRLAGINNQNFLMRDEQTGSFWQQISGRAIAGPLRGQQLVLVPCDELNFGTWRKEAPQGTVLAPVPEFEANYAKRDWEARMAKSPTVLSYAEEGLEPRTLVLGVSAFGAARAYRKEDVLREKLILDTLAGRPVMVVVAADGASIRVFERKTDEDFYRLTEPGEALLVDSAGKRWNFRGCEVGGARCLTRLTAIEDYWFDWRHYQRQTTVFGASR